MEQYELRPSEYYRSLNYALEHFKAEHLFIRLVGSQGGTVKVSERLQSQKLEFRRCRDGLRVILDGKEVFLYKQTSFKKDTKLSGKMWSLAYWRENVDGMMFHGNGYPNPRDPYTGPDDPRLPEVKRTMFRSVNRDHLIEVTFTGKIPIVCTGQLVSSIKDWFYWQIKNLNSI